LVISACYAESTFLVTFGAILFGKMIFLAGSAMSLIDVFSAIMHSNLPEFSKRRAYLKRKNLFITLDAILIFPIEYLFKDEDDRPKGFWVYVLITYNFLRALRLLRYYGIKYYLYQFMIVNSDTKLKQIFFSFFFLFYRQNS
jgi:hypothetical protein